MDGPARDAYLFTMRRRYVLQLIRMLRKSNWYIRHEYFKALRRIRPEIALLVAEVMGQDELLHAMHIDVVARDVVIALPDDRTLSRFRRVRPRLA